MSNFSVPEGYIEEAVDGRLCFEDLDDDSELWLIRVPSDIQLSDLDRKKIYLGSNCSDVNLTNIKTENGKILECCAENCEIQNMCVLLPEKDSKKLRVAGKKFEGAILISEGLDLNDDTEVKTESFENPQLTVVDDDISSHTHKRKKRAKHSRNSDVSFNNEIAVHEAVHGRKSVLHTSNSKENHGKTKIKSEPESIDSDDFPACTSQY